MAQLIAIGAGVREEPALGDGAQRVAKVAQRADQVAVGDRLRVTFARGKSVFIETEENDFVLTADMVRAALTPKTTDL